jgi:hypothetical protein
MMPDVTSRPFFKFFAAFLSANMSPLLSKINPILTALRAENPEYHHGHSDDLKQHIM